MDATHVLLERVDNVFLCSCSIRNDELILQMQVAPQNTMQIVCKGLVLMRCSLIPTPFEEPELAILVGELRIAKLLDGGLSKLRELGHPILMNGKGDGIAHYPGVDVFWVHMDGEVVADIVCLHYNITSS